MLKGVSRQIVEITQTENPYFERVFLVVRPTCREVPSQQLDKAAHRFLQQQSPHSGLKRAKRHQAWQRLVFFLIGSGLGAAAVFAAYTIL